MDPIDVLRGTPTSSDEDGQLASALTRASLLLITAMHPARMGRMSWQAARGHADRASNAAIHALGIHHLETVYTLGGEEALVASLAPFAAETARTL